MHALVGWPLRGLGANAQVHDHDHGTYGRLWESDIGVFIYIFMEYMCLGMRVDVGDALKALLY